MKIMAVFKSSAHQVGDGSEYFLDTITECKGRTYYDHDISINGAYVLNSQLLGIIWSAPSLLAEVLEAC